MQLQNNRILVIGAGGTGKSTYIHQLIQTEPRPKTIIYDTSANPHYAAYPIIKKEDATRWKKGICRIIDVEYEECYAILAQCSDTFIVLEDCTKYLGSKNPPKFARNLLFSAKQKQNDLLMTFHGFKTCDELYMNNCDWLIVFKTGEKIDRMTTIPMAEAVNEAYNRVKAHESKYYNESIKMQL